MTFMKMILLISYIVPLIPGILHSQPFKRTHTHTHDLDSKGDTNFLIKIIKVKKKEKGKTTLLKDYIRSII